MANIRAYNHIIKVVGGLLLSASAGAGKVLTSDAEGNASWAAPAKIARIREHAWAIPGEPSKKVYPGFSVALATGEEKKLIGIQYRIEAGTSCVVKLLLNKVAVEESEVTAKNEAAQRKTFSSATTLAAKDYLSIEVITLTGTPENLSFEALVESIA